MVMRSLKYGMVFILLLLVQHSFAQGHLFSRIKTSSTSVYVGEPVEVKVSVFTSTWFTKGVNPGNIKVNGAFTVYFRSVNSTERINGKTYAGVEMIFNVFPYEVNTLEFPSLEINVESPDEGTSTGVARIIKTESRKISVKPVPQNIDRENWIVASNVSVTQNWNGNLKQVKVGDVLERSISREIQGTIAELIPPISWDTIPGVSNYPVRAEVRNNNSKTAISASRTDGVKYLFEKEGQVIIPEIIVNWWNPQAKRMQKRTLQETVINVLPNPDLGMLESIRDSMQIISATANETMEEESPFTFLGMNWKQLAVVVLALTFLIYILVKVILKLMKKIAIDKKNYRNSELFYFREFEKAIRKENASLSLNALYRWIDQLNLPEPTVKYIIDNYGTSEMKLKSNDDGIKYMFKRLNNKQWRLIRNNVIKTPGKSFDKRGLHLNP